MPSFQKKTVVKSYKLRIKKKFKVLREETNDVVTKLLACVSVFEKRLEELLQKSDENFLEQYQKLTEDFESHQEKLCYFLTAIISTANEEDSEVSESEENLFTEETSKYPSDQVDLSSLLESKSSIVSSSYQTTQDNKKTTGSQFSSCLDQKKDVLPNHIHDHNEDLPVHASESFEGNPSVSPSSCMLSASSISKLLSISTDVLVPSVCANTEVKQIICDTETFRPVSSPEPECPISVNTEVKQVDCDISVLSVPEDNLQIPPCEVPLNEVFSASLSHIVNPSDFWMQLQSSKVNNMLFPLSEFYDDSPPPFMKKGSFCLAPLRYLRFYYRAKVLNDALGCEDVEVLFVDHGSILKMNLSDLRILPRYAYETPLQAFQCKLFNVLPVNGVWTPEAGEKLRGFQNNHIETQVKSLEGDAYVVQLTANISSFDEFSCDIAEALCLDDLAVLEMDPLLNQEGHTTENSNQASRDSGVSVSSNPTTSAFQTRCFSSDPLNSNGLFNAMESLHASFNLNEQASETTPNRNTYSEIGPFDSSNDTIGASSLSDPKLGILPYQQCSRANTCDCILHVTIPSPCISFVQKDMMLVMLSHIASPSEFYVNLAMEDSLSLDELQEKMTTFYENETNPKVINPSFLMEDMICAGRFDVDNNWYRVVILSTEHQNDASSEVYLQYIDYGNKAFVKCSNLRPLLPEFASYPSFSIKFSLAGIMPKYSDSVSSKNTTHWNRAAIAKFHQLTSFDRCLTAQVYESSQFQTPTLETSFSERTPIRVLLWDYQGAEELLINRAMLESGVADLDLNFMYELEVGDHFSSKEKVLLKYWDPMKDEFNSLSNSYGVDADDTEVAVSGYRQKDEDYTCHYYSLRGYCPRGKHCPFEHFELDTGGYTRDQDEVYSMDLTPSLPEDGTSDVVVTVSAIKSPGFFYSVLPFGKYSVQDVDLLHYTEPLECMKHKEEVHALYNSLNDHYNNSVFAENTTVALAYGSIVVAFHEGCKAWQRGRIVELTDITGPSRVFFVDFGDECWVPRRSIRQILPEFLFTPFQAVECRISDIEPLGYEKGEKWSAQAINRFKELVINEAMLAHITLRCSNSLHVKLKSTREDHHVDISEILVKEGFAQYSTVKPVKYKECKYMPG